MLPVIGLGTLAGVRCRAVVGRTQTARRSARAARETRGPRGGFWSPMYGRAETSHSVTSPPGSVWPNRFFSPRKSGRPAKASGDRLDGRNRSPNFEVKRIDLMQVHNLIDAKTHLATLAGVERTGPRPLTSGSLTILRAPTREWRRFLRSEKLDFLQINYSILEREAENQILPIAQERGVAVIIESAVRRREPFSHASDKNRSRIGRRNSTATRGLSSSLSGSSRIPR